MGNEEGECKGVLKEGRRKRDTAKRRVESTEVLLSYFFQVDRNLLT